MSELTINKQTNILSSLFLRSYSFSDLAFIIYYSYTPLLSLLITLSNTSFANIVMSILIFSLYVLSIYEKVKLKQYKRLSIIFLIYLTIGVIIFLTYLFRPEVREWLFHENWGIFNRVLNPQNGIFGLLVIMLVNTPRKVLANLQFPIIINFAYRMLDFIQARRLGAWLIIGADGVSVRYSQYSMGFGYAMITIAIFSIAYALYFKKNSYFIIAGISSLLSVLYGSRGTLVVIFLFLLLLILSMNNKILSSWVAFGSSSLLTLSLIYLRGFENIQVKVLFIIYLLIILSLIIVLLGLINRNIGYYKIMYYITFFNGILILILLGLMFFDNQNIDFSSRNLNALFSGDFLSGNGRDVIWQIAFEEIKRIFPLGLGFFGDRPLIGKYFAWGYSHNIIIEVLMSFGLLGIVLIVIFLYYLMKSFKLTKYSFSKRLLLIVFLSLPIRLLISDSFWYYSEFWSLLGLIILINIEKTEVSNE